MNQDYSSLKLKCPYCDDFFSSHRDMRVHIGKKHKEKTEEFMEEYFGGRWVEANFISLMMRITLGKLTQKICQECGGCDVECSLSITNEGLKPNHIPLKLLVEDVKEILRSDVIWGCTSCFACGENCKAGMPPYDVIETLKNLSARIGYHFPDSYKEYNKSIVKNGIINWPCTHTQIGEFTKITKEDVKLIQLPASPDLSKFKESIKKLSELRTSL
jgi:heterodisulfide reductase subunit C